MKKLLTIDIADNDGHKFGFNAFTEIEEDFDLMDKIKEAVSSQAVADSLELEKAYKQCHNCFSSWNYRGKQDQGWCYTHRNYMPECKDYRDS